MEEVFNIEKQPKLTQHGIEFIYNICSKGTNNLLTGTNGALVFSNDGNDNLIKKIWTAKVKNDNGNIINKNIELAPLLIDWFNQYGLKYNLDPNILAAQLFRESSFRVWAYPPKRNNSKNDSTAMGLSQFLMSSLFAIVIKNENKVTPSLTPNEIDLLTKGLDKKTESYAYDVSASNVSNDIAWDNHSILLQNVMDNPKIMIKGQAMYMKYFAKKCNGLASTSLFCYNRGTFMSDTYTKAITKAINYGNGKGKPNYIDEGVKYVDLIFKLLSKSFGYKLDFSFNVHNTTVIESEIYD